ncbi:MAG: exodeoxyribonuclease VII small subunit [Thermoanaerobaculum sp.]|nr:exodeoxyribonuclease VII small subunit [Thermoanaerobaculum sp.]MDW7968498.1 exodeoxyribonuclease VII small subunit [Thermoanaerobaculum sp.]
MSKETFEQALAELETIVAKLEDDSVPLEEALKLFERGVRLSKRLKGQLAAVERRVEQLLAEAEEGEEPPTAPFAVEQDSA